MCFEFHEILYLFSQKSVQKIQVLLKSDENTLHEDQCTYVDLR